jgi:hypothetical protein
MIAAYFDDSGTHGEQSDIVLVAGLIGTEARMRDLDRNWKRHLDSPLGGLKEPIKRFHAYDCDNSIGEFNRWTRVETDYFRHLLRTVIIEADVAAYGMACSRKDYDQIVTGDIRSIIGNPEGFCINQCFVRAVGWAQANTFDPKMSFVFDGRPPDVQRYTGAVFDAFKRWAKPPPELIGCEFKNSAMTPPLQAADMIAWELYRYANAILRQGLAAPTQQELLHLKRNMNFDAQMALPERITQVRDMWLKYFEDKPGWLEQFANHFDSFDPNNPDYSSLSDERS